MLFTPVEFTNVVTPFPLSVMSIAPGSAHLNYTLAAVVGIGGVYGYFKTRSLPSLIAGVSIGSLYAYSAYLISQNRASEGHAVATVTSAILTAAMGSRFYKTRKVMPAGMLTGIGAAATYYNGIKWREWSGN